MHITMHFDRIEAPRSPPPPPPSSQPRLTATARQRVALDNELSTPSSQAHGRDVSVGLRLKWTCTQQSCRNYGNACYWPAINSPEHHCPLTKDVIEAWIKDIRAGQNTMDHPGPIAYNLARLAKERLLLKGHEYVNPRSRF